MTDTTGNFQDLLQFSADTLYDLGEEFVVGNSLASTVTYGLSNSNGVLAIAGAPTANQTLWLPSNNGTLLSAVNVSAGTTSGNLSAVVFSNGSGVSFGLNGSTVTASVNAGGGSVNFSAGTTSNNLAAITFSNSNGVSFGLNGSTMTASVLPNIVVAAGTQTLSTSPVTLVLSNSNNVSFGMSASSIITGSAQFNISAGTTSNNLSALVFSNGSGVTFGLNGSTVTASVNAAAGGGIAAAAGTQTATSGTVLFSNSPSVSFGMSNSSVVTASAYLNVGAGDSLGASSSYATVSIVFFANTHITPQPGSVSFGISSGANAATITASVATSLQYFQVNDSVQNLQLATLNFSNSNGVSFGLSNLGASDGQITASCAVTMSAGASTAGLNAVTFSNSNGVSFGLSAGTITASVAGGGGLSAINVSAGTTSSNLTAFVMSNSNNITFGLNGATLTASYSDNGLNAAAAGTQTQTSGTVVFSNSNNVSFGMSNSSIVTASANLTGDWFDNIVMAQPLATGSGAMGAISNFTGSQSSLFVAPLHGFGNRFPFDITANTCFFPDVSISGSTATMSIAFTSVWQLGIYTLNASSLSLLNSASVSLGFAAAATNNSTGFAGGFRYGSFPAANWSSSPVFKYGSRYWLAWFWSSAGALNQTGSMAGGFNFSTGQRSGLLGASNLTATSNGAAPFYGIYTAQTAALPASIGSNQLQKTASVAGFVPHLVMANNASLTVF